MSLHTWKLSISEQRTKELCHITEFERFHNLDEINIQLPDGAYSTFRTYQHHKVLAINAHLERLRETARLSGYNLDFDKDMVRTVIREIVHMTEPACELRVRVTLLFQDKIEFYVSIESLKLPDKESYLEGVKVITQQFQRINARAKRTTFIPTAHKIRKSIPGDVNEVIMLDNDQNYLEGLSSNFFAVKNNVVWTANENVLLGTTRKIVIDLLKTLDIPVILEPLSSSSCIQEAFITSVSRGILPVKQINQAVIGKPGIITKKAMNLYSDYIESHLEDI